MEQTPNKPLSDDEVATQVKKLTSANKIAWTRHVEEKMASRGFDKGQIKECLKTGTFTERPSNPNRPGEITYAFRMQARVDGELMAVAASLIPSKKVIAITVFEIK